MKYLHYSMATMFLTLWANLGLGQGTPPAVDEEFQEWLLEELILAEPGATITLPEGLYHLDTPLSITTNNVTLKGQGLQKTVLSFKPQTTGAEGLHVSGNGITLTGFAIEDTKGDGIKIMRADGLVVDGVRVTWSNFADPANGAYGLYPVQSRRVLIQNSEVSGASDAGIYVGQSKDVVVRRNKVFHNVAGIEIENCMGADVYDNHTFENTAGILVFNLPSIKTPGKGTRVYQNHIHKNNTVNFAAPSNMVAVVPQGVGVMVMANREVEIYDNDIVDHQTTSILLVSFYATALPIEDPAYEPFVEKVLIYGNQMIQDGYDPQGGSNDVSKQSIAALRQIIGVPFPQIIFDGATSPDASSDDAICITPDDRATFINIDLLGDFKNISQDLAPHNCSHQRLKRVRL